METPSVEIESAIIHCQVCGQGFRYYVKNETQDCPWGDRNYRHTVMTVLKGELPEDNLRKIRDDCDKKQRFILRKLAEAKI